MKVIHENETWVVVEDEDIMSLVEGEDLTAVDLKETTVNTQVLERLYNDAVTCTDADTKKGRALRYAAAKRKFYLENPNANAVLWG